MSDFAYIFLVAMFIIGKTRKVPVIVFLLSNDCLASGITSAVGEQCLTNAGSLGVVPEPCLEAIAAGDGREVMKFDAEQLTHDEVA
jgi:hypothetical protein